MSLGSTSRLMCRVGPSIADAFTLAASRCDTAPAAAAPDTAPTAAVAAVEDVRACDSCLGPGCPFAPTGSVRATSAWASPGWVHPGSARPAAADPGRPEPASSASARSAASGRPDRRQPALRQHRRHPPQRLCPRRTPGSDRPVARTAWPRPARAASGWSAAHAAFPAATAEPGFRDRTARRRRERRPREPGCREPAAGGGDRPHPAGSACADPDAGASTETGPDRPAACRSGLRVGSTARPGSRPCLSGATTGGRLRPLRRGTRLRVRSRDPFSGRAGGLLVGGAEPADARILPVTAWLVGSAH